jgi:hypothetical protein
VSCKVAGLLARIKMSFHDKSCSIFLAYVYKAVTSYILSHACYSDLGGPVM